MQDTSVTTTTLATNVATALQVIGVVGSGVAWLYQAQATGLRGKIKTDLSLLKKARDLFGQEDRRAKAIEVKVTQLIDQMYRDGKTTGNQVHILDLVIGVAALGGCLASGWSAWHTHPATWQRVAEISATAFLGLMSLGGFLNAFNIKSSRST